MADTSLEYRKKLLKEQARFARQQKAIFDRAAKSISLLARRPEAKFVKGFKFPKYIEEDIKQIILDFHDDSLKLLENQATEAWSISNLKNDKIVGDYLKLLSGVSGAETGKYYLKNIPALKSFLSRKHGIETLSETVWKVAKQLRGEMEVHLGLGIANGDSADVISRRIRQYLNNPETLFRRVRDKETGKLIASKPMKVFHPGQGIYKSAYKNAVRLTRTTTNHAYLSADHERWMQMDMVIGVQISLSGSHPDYNFPEICELLEGVYPKDFIWTGWHVQCLCHETPVMASAKNFLAYLRGEEKPDTTQIKEYPQAFKTFAKENFKRFSNYKSVPYWLSDNIEIIQGLIK